ncbi:DUF1778 domain-containing protein [Kosakonia arachidis]|nr:DUF1778 domain-containing protein [Kosakonia arachidis]
MNNKKTSDDFLIRPLPNVERDKCTQLILNEDSWNRVINALANSPEPNAKLKLAARRLQRLEF